MSAMDRLEAEMDERSARLSPDARYYWQCHRPRYRYFIKAVRRLARERSFASILDVGMGFETLILGRLFPDSRIDGLGIYEDDRYRPENPFTFQKVDLNDLSVLASGRLPRPATYDLVVCMEVIEHLWTPPDAVWRYFSALLRPGGILFATTPNAAWLKNRLKLLCGRNPFETLKTDRLRFGHVREYTKAEIEGSFAAANLKKRLLERRGLYRFNNLKDRCYSRAADLLHPSLRRTLVAVYQK
jgi:SAM-dependent methyltransferase